MNKSTGRCLYTAAFSEFLNKEPLAVLGALHNNFHGDALTTTDEAWMGEIEVMQQVLEPWKEEQGQIVLLSVCLMAIATRHQKDFQKIPHACPSSMTERISI